MIWLFLFFFTWQEKTMGVDACVYAAVFSHREWSLTSVRGSSASRLAAGIWSSLGLFEDEDEDDDVVCSGKARSIQYKLRLQTLRETRDQIRNINKCHHVSKTNGVFRWHTKPGEDGDTFTYIFNKKGHRLTHTADISSYKYGFMNWKTSYDFREQCA